MPRNTYNIIIFFSSYFKCVKQMYNDRIVYDFAIWLYNFISNHDFVINVNLLIVVAIYTKKNDVE